MRPQKMMRAGDEKHTYFFTSPKQEATSGWNFTKCISEVKVNQLKVKKMHVRT